MTRGRTAPALAPPLYYDVDIGEAQPVKCLYNGLWLCCAGELRFAVLLSSHREYDREAALRIEMAAPAGAAGEALVQRSVDELEAAGYHRPPHPGKSPLLPCRSHYLGRSRGARWQRPPDPWRADSI